MAGTAPIVTDGFLFSPSLIVTAGFLSGTPVIVLPYGKGGYPKKKKKHEPRFQPIQSAGDTLRQILNDMQEREEEEVIMRIVAGYFQ